VSTSILLLELVYSTIAVSSPTKNATMPYGSVADRVDEYIKIGKNLGLRLPQTLCRDVISCLVRSIVVIPVLTILGDF
jgi:hypothetical protein